MVAPNAPFSRLEAWSEARKLVREVYDTSDGFPIRERYGLTSQLRRASVSVMTNIAEGSGRRTPGEFRQFLSIALGSLAEVSSLLVVAMDQGYIPTHVFQALDEHRDSVGRLTYRLLESTRRR
ncbi:MAG: four helix bundle protein [Gemmatimonadales bacterium]